MPIKGVHSPANPVRVLGRGAVSEILLQRAGDVSNRFIVVYRRKPEAPMLFLFAAATSGEAQHYATRWRDWCKFETFVILRY